MASGKVLPPALSALLGGQAVLLPLSVTRVPDADLTVVPSARWLRFDPATVSFGPGLPVTTQVMPPPR